MTSRQYNQPASGGTVVAPMGNVYIYNYAGHERFRLTPFAPAPPADGLAVDRPSRLLIARNEVVPFTGRSRELSTMTRWREDEKARSVWLWHGPGGQGKTRLSRQFATECAAARWTVVVARTAADAFAKATVSVPHDTPGVVLLVDYADRWDPGALFDLLRDPLVDGVDRMRVILLARNAFPWWPAMLGRLDEFGWEHQDGRLGSLDDSEERRREAFQCAVSAFARIYRREPPNAVATGSLTDDVYGQVLSIHMAALIAVDSDHRGIVAPDDPGLLSIYLTAREIEHWQRMVGESRARRVGRTALAAVLAGPTQGQTEANALVVSLGLAADSAEALAVIDDHSLCYPPTAVGALLEPLLPDRLAEDYLGTMLPGDVPRSETVWTAEALVRIAGGPNQIWRGRMLTVLTETARRWPAARTQLDRLVQDFPREVLATGASVVESLATAVGVEALATLERSLAEELPTDLVMAGAIILDRLSAHWLPSGDPAWDAVVLNELAMRLSHAGRHEEAVSRSADVVDIRRWLAADGEPANREKLAEALSNHGALLASVGNFDDAFPLGAEALTIFQGLADLEPRKYKAKLAAAIDNQSVHLSTAGHHAQALELARAANDIFRQIPAEDNASHLREYARSAGNLANRLAEVGEQEHALPVLEEAIAIERRLADVHLEQPPGRLAGYLNDLSHLLGDLGQFEAAVGPAEDAVAILRRLVATSPHAHLRGLTDALDNLTVRLAKVGRRQEALAVAIEARSLSEELAAASPAAYLPIRARSLSTLSEQLAASDHLEQALTLATEAFQLYQTLAARSPAVVQAHLATLAGNLAHLLSALDRHHEAWPYAQKSVDVRRALFDAEPAANRPLLAKALERLSIAMAGLDCHREAIEISYETVALYAQLVDQSPAYLPNLATSVSQLSGSLAIEGARTTAIRVLANSMDFYESLKPVWPPRFEEMVELTKQLHATLRGGQQESGAGAWGED
jgi:hypothetical protein